eukprot:Seg9674.1 transcript_id=Seg9674.1/GoldUCD/mRNA.D3Y31 product="hypothetical protein" protein_id=Seg9674.1/GoldUCD/D3Y31
MSGQEDYKRQKQKVIDLKKNKKEIPPVELYKLAGLLARWATSDKLPVCLLCQDSSKKIKQLGHIIPHSMLKLVNNIRTYDLNRGADSSVSKCGYFVFCTDCESKFQQGETHMNPEFFEQFFNNPKEKVVIKAKIKKKGKDDEIVVFPWFFYTLISIVWRCMATCADSCDFVEPLEVMRKFLINWNANTAEVDQKIQLFLFAPNEAVDHKLEGCQQYRRIFYECFCGNFSKVPQHGRILLGPLHVHFYYLQPSLDEPDDECLDFLEDGIFIGHCKLTAKADTFVMDESKSRCFPDLNDDGLLKFANESFSYMSRIPGSFKEPTTSGAQTVEAHFLHLLPKDVSYKKGKFAFPSSIYKPVFEDDDDVSQITGVMIGKERGLFVSFINGLGNGAELAMGLLVQDDNTVTYMKGVNVRQKFYINGKQLDQKTPLRKEWIEELYKDLLHEKFDRA